ADGLTERALGRPPSGGRLFSASAWGQRVNRALANDPSTHDTSNACFIVVTRRYLAAACAHFALDAAASGVLLARVAPRLARLARQHSGWRLPGLRQGASKGGTR